MEEISRLRSILAPQSHHENGIKGVMRRNLPASSQQRVMLRPEIGKSTSIPPMPDPLR